MTTLPQDWAFDAMSAVDGSVGWDSRSRLESLTTPEVAEAMLAFLASGFPDEAVTAEEILSERRRGGPADGSRRDCGRGGDGAGLARASV